MDDRQKNLQRILNSKLFEMQRNNAQYSIRAFAKKAKISSGTMSLILLGKRKASTKLSKKIAQNLMFDPQERSEVIDLPANKDKVEGRDKKYTQLSSDQFKAISEWHYFAILNLMKVRDFKNKPQWIAERLNLPTKKIEEALERLKRLGLIKWAKNGGICRTHYQLRTIDDIDDVAVKKSHVESLELAKESLFDIPLSQRDITSITLPFDLSKMALAKELIRKFQDDFVQIVQKKSKMNEVYRLNFNFFPLTNILKGSTK